MFQEDWVMRQVESIVNFLTMAVLNKKTPAFELSETFETSTADELHANLLKLIQENRINEAENLLFDKLDSNDQRYLEVAVDFYSKLNLLDDDTLHRCEFSREEIADGLKEVAGRFGIPLSELFQSLPQEEDECDMA